MLVVIDYTTCDYFKCFLALYIFKLTVALLLYTKQAWTQWEGACKENVKYGWRLTLVRCWGAPLSILADFVQELNKTIWKSKNLHFIFLYTMHT